MLVDILERRFPHNCRGSRDALGEKGGRNKRNELIKRKEAEKNIRERQ